MSDLVYESKELTMPNAGVYTIEDLIPIINDNSVDEKIEAVRSFLGERNKEHITKDEFAFLMTLDHYIQSLERAKTLLTKDRFTVQFIGSKTSPRLWLDDFRIIPLTKDDSGKPNRSTT